MKPEDQPSGEAARQQGAIVLVVEDEWIVRMAVADHLRGCGYRVLEAANADEAIAAFDANDGVAFLFTDIQMPGSMDGFAANAAKYGALSNGKGQVSLTWKTVSNGHPAKIVLTWIESG